MSGPTKRARQRASDRVKESALEGSRESGTDSALGREVWDEFCELLKKAGDAIWETELARSDFDRAEGVRYLSRLLRAGLVSFVENTGPTHPVFRPMPDQVKMGLDNPDNFYLNASIQGPHDYRIRGHRGTIHYLSFAAQNQNFAARDKIKEEFRIRQTTFKAADNNPLKFSANAEDAIHNLLVKRNPAYLGTTAAFDDAFKDVRHHQLAMLAGMRAAYGFMLQRFDPQALKAQFDAKPGRKGFGFGTQGRYWEAFEHYYREMTADSDDCFRRLFGDQFARAYEEQIQLLRSARDRTKNET